MRVLLVASAVALAGLFGSPGASAQDRSVDPRAGVPTEASSQTVRPRRARTRITIRPAREFHRECDFRLVREVRASGTYVVPRQRCWWVPYPPP